MPLRSLAEGRALTADYLDTGAISWHIGAHLLCMRHAPRASAALTGTATRGSMGTERAASYCSPLSGYFLTIVAVAFEGSGPLGPSTTNFISFVAMALLVHDTLGRNR